MMRAGFMFVLVAVVVGLVSCAPSADLRARIQAKLAQMKAKRGGPGGPGPAPEEPRFPSEWMEFASLVGRCEVDRRIHDLLEQEQSEFSLLTYACPIVYDIGMRFIEASEEEIKAGGAFIGKHLPVFMCTNLVAEMQDVAFLAAISGEDPEEDLYLKSTGHLAGACEQVFENLDEFTEDLEGLDETMGGEEPAKKSLESMLRSLLHTVSKRR